MNIGIEHIAIYSRNTRRLKEWYEELFGFKTVDDNGKENHFVKADDGSMIEFVVADSDTQKSTLEIEGIGHIAFSVDDFGEMYNKLLKAQVKTVKPISVSETGVKTYFFLDPEGNLLHIISRRQPL